MLRHTLATLAYRAGKVLRDAPSGFGDFRAIETGRSAAEILAHMGDLMDWAASIAEGRQTWGNAPVQSWDADVDRFFAALERLDGTVAKAAAGVPAERLFQGPIADALTHVGQLALMRRLAGVPIKGENYFSAEIAEGRVGREQAPPRREFD
jgi:hypothetical protein